MHRRSFLTLLGGAAAAWPLAVRAQQDVPVVAYLSIRSQQTATAYLTALRSGLADAGFVDGRNVRIELRAAAGDWARLQEMAAELVRSRVAVIVAVDSDPVIRIARAATTTIPIVFAFTGDPIKFGFVASINKPGGNMTGASMLSSELMGKRIDLLHKIAPQAAKFAFLIDSTVLFVEDQVSDAVAAGQVLGRQVIVVDAKDRNIAKAFATVVREGAGAVLVGGHVALVSKANEVVRLAARHRLPACYSGRFWCERGGLMS